MKALARGMALERAAVHWAAYGAALAVVLATWVLYGVNLARWPDSPDFGWRTMYFADSPRHKIWAFDYDAERGELSGEHVFAAPHPGFPDGSCVDAEGCLWNAEWGAARVVRYTPAGKVDRWIEVPAKNPTCCCFGGASLDTLYITSADRAGVFALSPGVKGLPESRFG